MSSPVFYRKWRPQTLSEVGGQEQVTQTLLNALSSSRISHAYLFCGPHGTGKTSTGRILAKAVNCLTNNGNGEPCNACEICLAITEGRAMDVIEIDAASNRGIDEIRELRERVNYTPSQARYKVYIIDEVHMLTKEASNALLKTLEEPPPHIIFILATTEAHKVLPTIMSRCQHFDFRRISQAEVVSKLASICQAEVVQIEQEGLRLIARNTTGSLRDAENLLEQLITYYGSVVDLRQVQAILGVTGDWRAKELVKHIVNNDISAGMSTINSVNSDGLDLRQFNRELVEYLRGLLLMKTGSDEAIDLTAEDIAELKEIAAKASLRQVLKAVKLFGQLELGLDNYSTLPLELALVDCIISAQEEPVSEFRQPAEIAAPSAASPKIEQVKEEVAEPEPPKVEEVKEQVAEPESTEVAAPAAQEATETVFHPTPTSEIEQLRLNWQRVINEAPAGVSKTPAAALLRSARPVALEEGTIILSFKYPLHKENMEKQDNRMVAEKIVSHFLGHACQIRCIHEPEDNHLVEAALKMGAQIIDTEEK